jgi:transposase
MTTKFHLAMTAGGRVVEGFLSGGNIADISVANQLFSDVYGCYILEDMGYDSDAHRDFLRSQNNIPVIPGRKNRKVKIKYDKKLYKDRGAIECFFGKLKENRRLAMRYDKSDSAFLGFIAFATLMIIIS